MEERMSSMPISTTHEIPGRAIDHFVGTTFGVVVRSMGFAKSFTGGFKALKRGEVSQYTETLQETRQMAIDRLVEHAKELGATAVVGLRFDSTDMGENQGMAEIVAYGTGVVLAD